jgi:hypothetical protein
MRTCEENLGRRMWASAYWRNSPAHLRYLLTKLDSPRASVYRRPAQAALASGDPERIAAAIRSVQAEIDRVLAERQKLAQHFPLLYSIAA